MIYNIINKYIGETITSGNIAKYDKKIGDKGTTKSDSVDIVVKNKGFLKTIEKLVERNGLTMEKNGNIVTIEGPTEKIRKVEMQIQEMGVE